MKKYFMCFRTTYLILSVLLNLFPIMVWSQMDEQPSNVLRDSLLQKGIQYFTLSKYSEAVEVFSKIDSSDGTAQFYLGMCCFQQNDIQNAISYMKRAVMIDSVNTSYRFQLARIYTVSGLVNDAKRELEFIVIHDFDFVPARFQLALLNYESKNMEQALNYFHEVIKKNPKDFLSYYYIGSALMNLQKSDSAIEFLSTSISLNPNYLPAINSLASIYFGKKEYHEAFRLFTKARTMRPEVADYHYKTGLCYQSTQNYDSAIVYYSNAIERDTSNDTYLAQLGYCQLMLQNYEEALSAYSKALLIDNENPLYYTNLALAYSKLDSVKQAASTYRKAIDVSHPEVITQMYIKLGTLYFYQKQYRNALSAYRRALDIHPSNNEAQYYVALTLDYLNDSKSAIKQYEKYLKLVAYDSSQMERIEQANERVKLLKASGKQTR
ncbi:MAG: tetratricopeptide repeat protein [Ignavibacteriae bacterium]|nr:tetratricopeptide repeat protein [Ignavibacteriota bacterium]